MKFSAGYQPYANFERALKTYARRTVEAKDPSKPEDLQTKIFCTSNFANILQDKPYRIVYYNEIPLCILLLGEVERANKKYNVGYVFFDEKRGLFENEVADFLLDNKEMVQKLRLIEVGVMPIAGLEETLDEIKKPSLAGSSPEQN
jgi:hypothetical protein